MTFINKEDRNTPIVIINDRQKLIYFYEKHKNSIYVGYNSRQYDQFLFKGIIDWMNPSYINDKVLLY